MELDTRYYNSHWKLSEIVIGFTFCYYKYLEYLFKKSLSIEMFNALCVSCSLPTILIILVPIWLDKT